MIILPVLNVCIHTNRMEINQMRPYFVILQSVGHFQVRESLTHP
jgi:hypothetical protein